MKIVSYRWTASNAVVSKIPFHIVGHNSGMPDAVDLLAQEHGTEFPSHAFSQVVDVEIYIAHSCVVFVSVATGKEEIFSIYSIRGGRGVDGGRLIFLFLMLIYI